MMKKISPRTAMMVVVAALVVYAIYTQTIGKTSTYAVTPKDYAPVGVDLAPSSPDSAPVVSEPGCEMKAGTGLASSLLPRKVATQEDFGQFAPEEILSGQNFLAPRNQIGFPESVGGALRNANQQVRAEPPNPKKPYVWQNSTIASDTMMRPLV